MKTLIITLILTYSGILWAHGDMGPHGGKIEMPGPFHVELVGKLPIITVYLLDMNFENPTIKDSKVEVLLKMNKHQIPLKCSPKKEGFECVLRQKIAISKGELVIKATREKAVGNESIFPIP